MERDMSTRYTENDDGSVTVHPDKEFDRHGRPINENRIPPRRRSPAAPDVFEMLAQQMDNQALSEGNVFADHPRYSKYKNAGKEAESQKARREEWLERQRSGRLDRQQRLRTSSVMDAAPADSLSRSQTLEVLDKERPISLADLMSAPAAEEAPDQPEWKPVKRSKRPGKDNRPANPTYQGVLMFSEWLIDVPMDFEDQWMMVMAPEGQRSLLVMENGQGSLWNKTGRISRTFRRNDKKHGEFWIDCIVSHRRIYILDFLKANGMNLEECDFDCRRGIGKAAIDEIQLTTETGADGHNFEFMEAVPCQHEEMRKALEPVQSFNLDGLLFYHRAALYTAGITPLVGWLKPFMMVEVLHVNVPQYYMEGHRPSQKEFIDSFKQSHPTYGLPIRNKKGGKNRSRTTSHTDEFMDSDSPSTSKAATSSKPGSFKTSH